MGRVGASVLLTVTAVVLFVLAAVVAPPGDALQVDLIAWGLAAYALGRIVP